MSFVDETAIAVAPTTQLTPQEVLGRVQLVQQVMTVIMKKGEHYGIVPGCGNKPTLLLPGAQVLAMTFQLDPEYDIIRTDLGAGHREEMVKCLLRSTSGARVGMGVGSCSTMEKKFRYRNNADYEITGIDIPKDAKEKKKEYRAQGYGMKMIDGIWEWVKYSTSQQVENPDIADTYNTVLKMAKKRAFVDAVLTATAASDMFTQDLEDIAANAAVIDVAPQNPKPEPKPQQAAPNPLLANVEAKVALYMELTGLSKNEVVAKMEESLDVRLRDIGNSAEAVKAAETVIQWLINEVVPESVYETEDIEF